MKKRLLSTLLAFAMIPGLCMSAVAAEEENPWAGIDTSEYMEINFYVPGDPAADWEEIITPVNERMEKLINTKVNVHFVSWGDYDTKLSLFLAGDEDVDLIYGASWLGYTDYVKNGGYYGFDWDFVEANMPMSAKNQAESSWKETLYDGLYYGVPNNMVSIGWNGAWTRQSLLDKYGYKAEEINSYEKLIEFLDCVAADTAETGIYAINPQGNYPMEAFHWFTTRYHLMDVNAGAAHWMVWKYNTGKEFAVEDLKWFAETDEYREFCLQMADFYKKGYFPASVISNASTLDDNYYAGTGAFLNAGPSSKESITAQLGGETPAFMNCYWDDECVTRRGNYFCYATCLTPASQKKERAATALDVMKFDPEINMLLVGGIEGRHYVLNEDGTKYTPGPEAADYAYNSFANQAAIQNDANPTQALAEDMQPYQDMYEAAIVPSETFPINGFNYDSAEYEAEISALSALFNEFRFSFCFGLFGDDTEAKLDEFIAQCKAIGIDDVCNDYREQLKAYIAG